MKWKLNSLFNELSVFLLLLGYTSQMIGNDVIVDAIELDEGIETQEG